MVIVHPFIQDGFTQHPVFVELVRQFHVYSVTLPGLGGIFPNLPKTLNASVDFLDKLFQNKYLDSFVLIGVSLAGSVVMEYAIQHPMHIRKLILANPTGMHAVHPILSIPGFAPLFKSRLSSHLQTRSKLQKFIQNLMYQNKFSFGAYLPAEALQQESVWPKQAADTISMLGKKVPGIEKRIHRIQKPVLLIGGNEDRIVTRKSMHDLEGHLQTVTLKFINRSGHLGILENPDEYLVKIEQFI